MKELICFYLQRCPYCREATAFIDALKVENTKYAHIPIKFIEESQEIDLSDSYDYYYVPTFFLGEKKLHEGASTKEKIRAVLDDFLAAL